MRKFNFRLLPGWSTLLAMRKFAGMLLVLLATACPALAAPKWVEVNSPHFKVLTDAGPYEALALAEQFERMRETFTTLLRTNPSDAAPVLVIALRNGKEFRQIEPAAYLGKGKLDLAGYFMERDGQAYILLRLDTEGPHPYATIYHEYTHYILRDDYTWMPLWLNEGLAEFYQNTDIYSGEVDLGQPNLDDLMYLRDHKLIPVATLMQITASSPYYHEEQKGTIFYAESWALVHYLIVLDRQNGTERLEAYENNLMNREDGLTAARNAFGSLRKLDKDLSDYLDHLSYAYFRLKLNTRMTKAEFHIETVPATDADAIRAGVMVDSHRLNEARTLLQSVLKQEPNSAMANRMMGYLELRSGDWHAAENWYAGALHLDPNSYMANYRFAQCAMRNRDEAEDTKVEAALRKTIALNPNFAPAYDLLARFYDIHLENEPEAHMLEVKAVALEPENVQYRLNTAVGLANAGDFDNALRVLDTARQVARNHAEMAMIDEISQRVRAEQAMLNRSNSQMMMVQNTHTALGSATVPHNGTETSPMRAQVTTIEGSKPVISVVSTVPNFPSGPQPGTKHIVNGVIKKSICYDPSTLVLTLDTDGKNLTLYRNNYFHIKFSTLGVQIKDELHPCTEMVGMHAQVTYAEVHNSAAAGQILTIQLTK